MFLGLVNSIDVCSSLLYNPSIQLMFVPRNSCTNPTWVIQQRLEQTSIELTNPRNIRGYNSEEQTSIEFNPRTWVIQQRGTNINRID